MRQTKTRVLVLMCVAMLLGYMPWYSFSAAAKYLVQEFGLAKKLSSSARLLGEQHDWKRTLAQWDTLFMGIFLNHVVGEYVSRE